MRRWLRPMLATMTVAATIGAWPSAVARAADGPGSNPANFVRVGAEMYFGATDGKGTELWSTDGTTAGTLPVTQATPFQLMRVGPTLYFTMRGSIGDSDTELWRSDGTEAGTSLVRTVPKDPATLGIVNLAAMGSELFFSSSDPAGGAALWKSDGTAAGTVKVRRFPGSSPTVSRPIPLAGAVYFAADDGIHGTELWKSDGTTTSLVEDVNPGAGDGIQVFMVGDPEAMLAWGSRIYFAGNDGDHGLELWRSGGANASMVRDGNHGPDSSGPSHLAAFGDLLLFTANDGLHGDELWKSDGTHQGTVLLKDINRHGWSRVRSIVKVGKLALFVAGRSGILYRTNGTTHGTRVVRGPDSAGPVGVGDVSGLVRVSGIGVLFQARGTPGDGLWKSRGWRKGTVLVRRFTPSESGEPPAFITAFGRSRAVFSADDGTSGQEPWVTDGTRGGTTLLKDINQ